LELIKINAKKIFLYILITIVAFLVITAFYYNRYKFNGTTSITRYTKVSLEYETNLNELANKYSDNETKEKFVSEIRRINNIDSSDYIPGNSTIIVPIIVIE